MVTLGYECCPGPCRAHNKANDIEDQASGYGLCQVVLVRHLRLLQPAPSPCCGALRAAGRLREVSGFFIWARNAKNSDKNSDTNPATRQHNGRRAT